MNISYTFSSLCRIAQLDTRSFGIQKIPLADWSSGDYVVVEVTKPGSGRLKVELCNGRMTEPMKGDLIVGAFGTRFATLEATGSWETIEEDGHMHLLTGAGLLGRLISKSVFIPEVIGVCYRGHVMLDQQTANMMDFVEDIPVQAFSKPVVLMVGTSMSAVKTTVARIVTRQLKERGLKVVGAKLTGAGRYRDILAVKDAGADYIFDFVDVGLPSSICAHKIFKTALLQLLSRIEATDADVAVIEIGASPLEPYNGDLAIHEIMHNIKCIILCASDPYAVYGVMKSFQITPNLVSGIATNTLAGIDLIEKLCQVPALNLIDPKTHPKLQKLLGQLLEL